jgi:hypothetical protein
MSNIISFQKALDNRKVYNENKEKIDSLIYERSKTYQDFYSLMAKEEELRENSSLMSMFFTTINESFSDPRFTEGFKAVGGIIEPDTNFIVNGNIVNCLRFYNSYNGKDFPKNTATIIAFGTENGLQELMHLDAQSFLENADTYYIDDIREVRQLFYDYMNEHPDVNTQRDALGELSVLIYQAISCFIENGYFFSRYSYGLIRQEEKCRSIPTPIILEFLKENAEAIYIYYDYESAMCSFEAMLEDIFGDDE